MVKKITVLLTVALILSSIFTCLVYAAHDTGVVTTNVLNVRSGAGTEFSVVGQLYNGQTVQIMNYTSNGWLNILYNNSSAYVSSQYVSVRTTSGTSRSGIQRGVAINTYAYVTADYLNFRFSPDFDSNIITVLPKNTQIYVLSDIGYGWGYASFNGITGYLSLEHTKYGYISSQGNPSAPQASSTGQQVVDYAKQFLGKPYTYGGNGPNSFDCSGFTKFVFAHFGKTINRIAADQASNGVYVEKSNLQPGDLILFANGYGGTIGHVGIYIGGGQFIHASTNSYTVRIDNLSGHYDSVYHSARRIL